MADGWNYHIQVFGDSIHWGQGLLPEQKMAYLFSQKLQKKNKKLKIRISSNAHSGAIIGDRSNKEDAGLNGEIPRTYPTILGQVDLANNKEGVDLVLVNGGINDVDVTNILNPITTPSWIRTMCKKMCHDRMALLLRKIMNMYSDTTKVIVTGYYQIVSNLTLVNPAIFFYLGISNSIVTPLVMSRVIENSRIFSSEANKQLASVVRETAQKYEGRIAFADPSFEAKNAILVPFSSYLFGLTILGNPEDPLVESRRKVCPKTGRLIDPNHAKCLRASAGHPNMKGEIQYANQIFKVFTDNWPMHST